MVGNFCRCWVISNFSGVAESRYEKLTHSSQIEMDELEALLIEFGILESEEEAEKLAAMNKTEEAVKM